MPKRRLKTMKQRNFKDRQQDLERLFVLGLDPIVHTKVHGLLRHMRTPTTTDTYMQIIPAGVTSTLNSINSQLRRKKPEGRSSKAAKSKLEKSPRIPQAEGRRKEESVELTSNDAKYQQYRVGVSMFNWLIIKGILVDLIGIEPMTSSMP